MNKPQRSSLREAGLETVEWVIMLVLIVIVAAGGFALLRGPILDKINSTVKCISGGTCQAQEAPQNPHTLNTETNTIRL